MERFIMIALIAVFTNSQGSIFLLLPAIADSFIQKLPPPLKRHTQDSLWHEIQDQDFIKTVRIQLKKSDLGKKFRPLHRAHLLCSPFKLHSTRRLRSRTLKL
jgi:hypothetical protein